MRQNSQQGYTLVEALISVLIMSVMLLGVYGVLQTGNTLITNDNAAVETGQQVRNAMDRIMREVRESSAATISTLSATNKKITFTTPNETNIQYYLSGTNLVREYPSGTVKTIASSIGSLGFSLTGSLLKIDIRGDKTYFGKTISLYLTEKVRLRNE